METIYYLTSLVLVLGLSALIIALIVCLAKPGLLNKSKHIIQPVSRAKIAKVGLAAIAVTVLGSGIVMGAIEPASIKQARAAEYAQQQKEELVKQQTEQKHLLEIEAAKPKVKTETKLEPLVFEATEQQDGSIPLGERRITTTGVNGERTITYDVTYVKGKEAARTETKNEVTKAPVNQVTSVGTYVKPAPTPRIAPAPRAPSNCDPNYSGCVPNVSYDLDCPDIGFSVRVLGTDRHRFDRDGDGYGCESY